ncbi:MAG: hypothetical protein V1738_04905 [Patescibacteria group bacterium]
MDFEYGAYDDYLRECYEKFGGILELPIVHSVRKEIVGHYQTGNVLDLGAGKLKPLSEAFKDIAKEGRYHSLDTDPKGEFDFRSIDEIPSHLKFSLITANQVFEHLTVEESLQFLSGAVEHLVSGGFIIATVPNIAHPMRQISNITHKTPWGHHSFFALFKMCGLEPKRIVRYSKRLPKGIIERILGYYMNRLYRMDYCDSILLIAEKP